MQEVEEIKDFLKDPSKYKALAPASRAACCCTVLPEPARRCSPVRSQARAGVPFYAMAGSDFVEMFVGLGASRVRDLFDEAKKNAPAIIFIDEIDKIAKKKNTNQRDVSGEAVQQGMLKLLEGSDIEVPVGANSKNANGSARDRQYQKHSLYLRRCFPDLTDIIKERLNKTASIGFQADLKDKYDGDKNLLSQVTLEDLRTFGMVPEFLGRLPIVFTLESLNEDMLVEILKEPKNAILKQYKRLLELDEVKLEFDDDALRSIAKKSAGKRYRCESTPFDHRGFHAGYHV